MIHIFSYNLFIYSNFFYKYTYEVLKNYFASFGKRFIYKNKYYFSALNLKLIDFRKNMKLKMSIQYQTFIPKKKLFVYLKTIKVDIQWINFSRLKRSGTIEQSFFFLLFVFFVILFNDESPWDYINFIIYTLIMYTKLVFKFDFTSSILLNFFIYYFSA